MANSLTKRLALSIEPGRLVAAVYNPAAELGSRLECHTIELRREVDIAGAESLPEVAELEEAVYANPALLSPFAKVDVVVASPMFAMLPAEWAEANPERAEEALAMTLPAESTDSPTVTTALPLTDRAAMTMLMSLPAKTDAFLRRTFNNPMLHHPLQVLITLLSGAGRLSGRDTINAHFSSSGRMLLFASSLSGKLLMANSIACSSESDALYYILNAADILGLDRRRLDVALSGSAEMRGRLSPRLRDYVAGVMATVLPSAVLREGAGALSTPLHLSALLCE